MNSNRFVDMILSNLWMVPQGLAMLVGLVMAIVNWSRHPTVSMLAAVAFVAMLLNLVVGHWVVMAVLESDFDSRTALTIVSLFRSCLGAVALVLLAMAVFMGRGPRADEAYQPEWKPQNWK